MENKKEIDDIIRDHNFYAGEYLKNYYLINKNVDTIKFFDFKCEKNIYYSFIKKLMKYDLDNIIKIVENSKPIFNSQFYGYNYPNMSALIKIKKIAKKNKKTIIEIGAGKGLWSALLKKMKVDIYPIDLNTKEFSFCKIHNCDYYLIDSYKLPKKVQDSNIVNVNLATI